MDSSDLKDLSGGPMKIMASGPNEYILGDALDAVPDDKFGTLGSEDVKESMSKWCSNNKEDDKSDLAELEAQVTNYGNRRSKRLKQEDTIKKNTKEDDKSDLAELKAQVTNYGNRRSKRLKQEDTIKKEELDAVSYPSESYIPSTYATQDLVPFVKSKNSKMKVEKIQSDNTFEYHPKPRLIARPWCAEESILPDLSCSDEQDESKEKNFKSLQCTSNVQQFTDSKRIMNLRHSSVYKNSTSLPNNNPPIIYSLPNELTCRYCLKVFKTNKGFRNHNQLGCKSYLKVAIEKGKPQNVKSKVQKNVKVKQDNLPNKSSDHDLYRSLSVLDNNFKEQTAIHFSQQNTHAWKHKQEIEEINNTHLERSTRNVVKCIDGIACKNSDKQFSYSVENKKNSLQCNSIERNSPLNECKSVEAVTSSLPEEKSKSEETTTEVVWTDGECSSDDNRQEELFDSSDSCSGDIFCKCIRCRKKHCDNPPKAKYKNNCDFPCDLCNKRFRERSKLKMHKESKCGSLKLFNCEVCCRGFATKTSLKEHINTVHCVEKPFTCDICQAKFANKNRLLMHVTKVHQKKSITLHQTCEFCKKGFSSKKTLRVHISTCHSEDRFICAHCSKVLNSKEYLACHIKKKHLIRDMFKCRKCSKSFVTEKGLQNHLSQNCSPKVFVCEICAKMFNTKVRLEQHLLIHTGNKSFVCDTCGKCFRTESNLHQHSRSHSDKRPFTCDVCDKSFRIKHHLRQHMAVHGMVNTSSARNRKQ